MSAPGARLRPGWIEAYTEDGELYYWNEDTDETTWERPARRPPPPPARREPQPPKPLPVEPLPAEPLPVQSRPPKPLPAQSRPAKPLPVQPRPPKPLPAAAAAAAAEYTENLQQMMNNDLAIPEVPAAAEVAEPIVDFIEVEYDVEEEGQARAFELQCVSDGAIMSEGRRCVKEGCIFKPSRSGTKPHQVFLFNDAIIFSELSKITGRYVVKREVPLNTVKLEDAPEEHAFKFFSTQESFVLQCSDAPTRDVWVAAIEAQIENNAEVNGAVTADTFFAPIFVDDQDAPNCQVCGRGFSFLNRRHHCRRCGQVICNSCSYEKVRVPGLDTGGKLVRTCIPCGNEIKRTRRYGQY